MGRAQPLRERGRAVEADGDRDGAQGHRLVLGSPNLQVRHHEQHPDRSLRRGPLIDLPGRDESQPGPDAL